MTKQRLEAFCRERGIFVPTGASKTYLEAAIVRSYFHGNAAPDAKTCFGFWEDEDSACRVCDFEKACRNASLGMDFDLLKKKVEAAENPKLRFASDLRPPRFSQRTRKGK